MAFAIGMVANAASIDWSFSEQARDSSNPASLDGYSAYLFTHSVWEAAVAAGVTADTFADTSYADTASLTKTTGGTTTTWSKWATNSPETWTDDAAASGNYYIVLYNGEKFTASSAIAATAYASAQEAHTAGSWAISVSKTPLAASDFSTVNVPEPTSGLLLLIGVAGLALKRKRA